MVIEGRKVSGGQGASMRRRANMVGVERNTAGSCFDERCSESAIVFRLVETVRPLELENKGQKGVSCLGRWLTGGGSR